MIRLSLITEIDIEKIGVATCQGENTEGRNKLQSYKKESWKRDNNISKIKTERRLKIWAF